MCRHSSRRGTQLLLPAERALDGLDGLVGARGLLTAAAGTAAAGTAAAGTAADAVAAGTCGASSAKAATGDGSIFADSLSSPLEIVTAICGDPRRSRASAVCGRCRAASAPLPLAAPSRGAAAAAGGAGEGVPPPREPDKPPRSPRDTTPPGYLCNVESCSRKAFCRSITLERPSAAAALCGRNCRGVSVKASSLLASAEARAATTAVAAGGCCCVGESAGDWPRPAVKAS